MVTAELPPLREVIAAHGLDTKKSLGQHFLLDINLLAKIARAAGNLAGKHVVEIGPGPGGLTRALLATEAASVTAVEKDSRCIAALAPLKDIYGDRFHLIEADALSMPIETIAASPRVVVANLPYNIGTELIVRWLQASAKHGRQAMEGFTVMLQKEVAQRLVAEPRSKAYGRLSVLARQYCDAEIVFDVPPGAFLPPPKVTSSILRATILPSPREEVLLADLEPVVASAFNQRRKMLRQSLRALGVDAQALCAKAGIDETWRAEQCELKDFAALARAWQALRA